VVEHREQGAVDLMAGDLLALGAAGALALAAVASKRGSASQPERPRIFFDDVESVVSVLRPEIERAAREEDGWRRLVRVMLNKEPPDDLIDALGYGEIRGVYATWAFERAGRQTFVLGPRMQELLARTSVEKIPMDFVRWPYSSYFLSLPGCTAKLYKPGRGFLFVRGITVTVLDENLVKLLIWAPGRDPLDYVDASVLLDFGGAEKHPGGLEGYLGVVHRYNMEIHGHNKVWPQVARETVAETNRLAARWVVNSMLYLQSENAERKLDRDRVAQAQAVKASRRRLRELERLLASSPKRKVRRAAERERDKLTRSVGRLPPPGTLTWLGGSMELDPNEPARQAGDRGPVREHWVKGHWKVPWRKHGPPVLRWIMPFKRGRGKPAYRQRTYRLAGDRQDGEE